MSDDKRMTPEQILAELAQYIMPDGMKHLDALRVLFLPAGHSLSDDDLRQLWRAHGGSFHGPHVETGTMPEESLLPLLRALTSPTPGDGSVQVVAGKPGSASGKPTWDEAPEWAEWLAQDEDGEWSWYNVKPEPLLDPPDNKYGMWGGDFGGREHDAKRCADAGVGPVNPDWLHTLEPRPRNKGEGPEGSFRAPGHTNGGPCDDTPPVGYVNGDELDNMLNDRPATLHPVCSGLHKTPLYPESVKIELDALRIELEELRTLRAINEATIDDLRATDWAAKLVDANRENAELLARLERLEADKAELVRQHNQMIDAWHAERESHEVQVGISEKDALERMAVRLHEIAESADPGTAWRSFYSKAAEECEVEASRLREKQTETKKEGS